MNRLRTHPHYLRSWILYHHLFLEELCDLYFVGELVYSWILLQNDWICDRKHTVIQMQDTCWFVLSTTFPTWKDGLWFMMCTMKFVTFQRLLNMCFAIETAWGKVKSVSRRSCSFKASSWRPKINWSRVNSFLPADIHPYSHRSIFNFNLVKYASMDLLSSWSKVQNPYLSYRTLFWGEQNQKCLNAYQICSCLRQLPKDASSCTSCPVCDNIMPIFTPSLFSVDSVPARNHCNCSLKSY